MKKTLASLAFALMLAAGALSAAAEPNPDRDTWYREGRQALDERRWDEAVRRFSEGAEASGEDADAALYWKAYAHYKAGDPGAAQQALIALRRDHPESRWQDDARALEVEMGSVQRAVPGNDDEELKLYALQSLMHSDSERAVELVERFLSPERSKKLRERALFVLSQSSSPRARTLLMETARGQRGDEMQLMAMKHLAMAHESAADELMEIYRSSSNQEVRKTALHAFVMSGDVAMLLEVAQQESDPELKKAAVHGLGMTHSAEALEFLGQLYRSASEQDVKKDILHAFMMSGDAAKLLEIAESETDQDLRKAAVHGLGMTHSDEAMEYLGQLYRSASDRDTKKAVLHAFVMSGDAAKLIELAKSETDPELRKAAIQRIGMIGSDEAIEFMMEILEEE